LSHLESGVLYAIEPALAVVGRSGMSLIVHTTLTPPNTAVALCCGEVDVSSCAKLIDALDAVVHSDVDRVIVDMRQVTFIDSTGIGCLLHGAMAARERGTPFRIIPGATTRSFIETSRLAPQLAYLTEDGPENRDAGCGDAAAG
jgi:anti-sigma B factor antagonist